MGKRIYTANFWIPAFAGMTKSSWAINSSQFILERIFMLNITCLVISFVAKRWIHVMAGGQPDS